jgi:hypothetical protein
MSQSVVSQSVVSQPMTSYEFLCKKLALERCISKTEKQILKSQGFIQRNSVTNEMKLDLLTRLDPSTPGAVALRRQITANSWRIEREDEYLVIANRILIRDRQALELHTQQCVAGNSDSSQQVVLTVRLMSGDIFHVSIDMSHSLSTFADSFAQQNGYHSCVTARSVFMILQESDVKSDDKNTNDKNTNEIVFWSPEQRHPGKTYADILPSTDSLPIIHLIIRPASEDEWDKNAKISLIRRVLKGEDKSTDMTDDDLYTSYADWLLTYHPPPSSNRFTKIRDFVLQYNHFQPIPMT